MRIHRYFVVLAMTALLVPAGAGAQSNRQDAPKVTGGGQIIVDFSDVRRPGDTITFRAEQTDPTGAARGELRLIRTLSASEGGAQVAFHGTVTCLQILPGPAPGVRQAVFGGQGRDSAADERPFSVTVWDFGRGPDVAGGPEPIWYQEGAPPCTPMAGPVGNISRGEVTIHTADD